MLAEGWPGLDISQQSKTRRRLAVVQRRPGSMLHVEFLTYCLRGGHDRQRPYPAVV